MKRKFLEKGGGNLAYNGRDRMKKKGKKMINNIHL